jgi:hypothetical protein
VGSRAAKRLQPGDLVRFTQKASGYNRNAASDALADVKVWTRVMIGCCGLVIDGRREDPAGRALDPEAVDDLVSAAPLHWTACLIDGEVLWFPMLEMKTKRLNRRSP